MKAIMRIFDLHEPAKLDILDFKKLFLPTFPGY